MSKGYVSAYHGARNMSELKLRIQTAAAPVIENVLEDLFGVTISKLGRKERKFLGID
jgi:hypothetical protein